MFIGSDFHDIKPYKEFEVSPPNEWVDLDINLSAPRHEDGWQWTPDLSPHRPVGAHLVGSDENSAGCAGRSGSCGGDSLSRESIS